MPGTLAPLIHRPKILTAPGIYDSLSAVIATQAGAEALYLSGASIAYTRFGRPDIGLVTMSEVADTVAAIADRVETPLIVDADTGFGNALNVQRTVRAFERAGAGALQLEDQSLPKRCGHLAGKGLVPAAEMVGKIKAALDARQHAGTLIIARTDAIAVEGLESALDRAALFADAGADILFVEAPSSVDDMRRVVADLGGRAPLLANIVEGGRTPELSASELEALGFALVIFPGGLARAVSKFIGRYFDSLLAHGSNRPFCDEMLDFDGLNELIGTADMLARGRRYDG